MSPEPEPRFDPRFDPAYQPGFDGAPRDARSPRSASKRPDAAPAAQAPTRSADFTSAAPPHTDLGPTTSSTIRPATAATIRPATAAQDFSVSPEEDAELSSRANPYLSALWIISAVLVAAGGAIIAALPELSIRLQRTAGPDVYFYSVQALVIGAPLLIALGLTTVVALLFRRALRWGRRGEPGERE